MKKFASRFFRPAAAAVETGSSGPTVRSATTPTYASWGGMPAQQVEEEQEKEPEAAIDSPYLYMFEHQDAEADPVPAPAPYDYVNTGNDSPAGGGNVDHTFGEGTDNEFTVGGGANGVEVSNDHASARIGPDDASGSFTFGGKTVSFGSNGSDTLSGGAGASGLGGFKIGANGSLTFANDETFTHISQEGWAAETLGGPVATAGDRDALGGTAGGTVGLPGGITAGAAVSALDESRVSFHQTIDRVTLPPDVQQAIQDSGSLEQWIVDNPEAYNEAVAANHERYVGDVENPGDLDLLVGYQGHVGLDGRVLPEGSAYEFNNTSSRGSSESGGIGVYSVKFGESETSFDNLTIARPVDGPIVVTLGSTDQDQTNVGIELAAGGMGFSESENDVQEITFEIDPTNDQQLIQLQRFLDTGVLPGAEVGLSHDDQTEFSELTQSVKNGSASEADEARLAELATEANAAVMSGDVDLTDIGGAEYVSRLNALEQHNASQLGFAGFNLWQETISESLYEQDYIEDGEQETAYGYRYGRVGDGQDEWSHLVLNPENAGPFEMLAGGAWETDQAQAQLWTELGLSGSDDFRVQEVAGNGLHSSTSIATASVAIDGITLENMSEAFRNGASGPEHWAEFSERFQLKEGEDLEKAAFADFIGSAYGGIDISRHSGRFGDDYEHIEGPDYWHNAVGHVEFTDLDGSVDRPAGHEDIEAARRAAWHANSEEILESAAALGDTRYETVDDLIEAVRDGSADQHVIPYLDQLAGDDFFANLSDIGAEIVAVSSPEDFAELPAHQQEIWIDHYVQNSGDESGFWALEMVQGAVDAAPAAEREQLHADLTRHVFRSVEQATDSDETATSEFIEFIGDLSADGGPNAALAEVLASGVHVSIQDEGVLERASDIRGAGVLSSTGELLQPDHDLIGDIGTETSHLLDNNGERDADDADQLYDRLEGYALAAGPNKAAAVNELVRHLATEQGYESPEAFIADLAINTDANGEYSHKLDQFLEGSDYAQPTTA